MSKNRILVLGLFALLGLGGVLFFLPKSIVDSNRKLASENKEEIKAILESQTKDSTHTGEEVISPQILELKSNAGKEQNPQKKSGYLVDIGKVFLKSNRFDSAGHYFEVASQTNKQDTKLIFQAGNAYFEGIAFVNSPSKVSYLSEKARECFNQVPETDPNRTEAQAKVALTFVNSESPMKGILKLRELSEKNPENEFVAYQLGLLSYQSGQFEKAVGRFEKVWELNKKNVNACFYMAQSLTQLGKSKEALLWVEKGLKIAVEEDTKASFIELKSQLSGN